MQIRNSDIAAARTAATDLRHLDDLEEVQKTEKETSKIRRKRRFPKELRKFDYALRKTEKAIDRTWEEVVDSIKQDKVSRLDTRRVVRKDEHGNPVEDDKGKLVYDEIEVWKSAEERRAHEAFASNAMDEPSEVNVHRCEDPIKLLEEHCDDGVFPAIYDLAFMWEDASEWWESTEEPAEEKKGRKKAA